MPPPPQIEDIGEVPGMEYLKNTQALLKTYGVKAATNPNKIIKGMTEQPQDISGFVDQPPPPPMPQQ